MEYVILDLEWDSVYYQPLKRFINQVLQIGAVKLDGNFDVKDTFSVNICSEICDKVTSRFSKLTGITSEIMREGIPFRSAVERYNIFAENADVTMTWSNSDLYTIIENEDYLLDGNLKFKMRSYLDLQKLVQQNLYTKGYESKNQISLEAAAEFLKIDISEIDFYTALDDCLVCAELFKISYDKTRFEALKKDTSGKDFYDRLRFKPYAISDINDRNIKKSQLEFSCPKCKSETVRISNWKYKNRWFSSNFKCGSCGFRFDGRVAFKKTFDDIKIKYRVCDYKPKKRIANDMQSVRETVPGSEERN